MTVAAFRRIFAQVCECSGFDAEYQRFAWSTCVRRNAQLNKAAVRVYVAIWNSYR